MYCPILSCKSSVVVLPCRLSPCDRPYRTVLLWLAMLLTSFHTEDEASCAKKKGSLAVDAASRLLTSFSSAVALFPDLEALSHAFHKGLKSRTHNCPTPSSFKKNFEDSVESGLTHKLLFACCLIQYLATMSVVSNAQFCAAESLRSTLERKSALTSLTDTLMSIKSADVDVLNEDVQRSRLIQSVPL